MEKHNWLAGLLLSISLAASAADPPALAMDEPALAAHARAHVEKTGARGVLIEIVHADGRVVRASAGSSGRAERPALDGATLFEIGSITKGFTGILAADMARRGEIALDDPIDKHLPEARAWKPGAVRAITIRQLMTHTSGLPRLPEDARLALSMALHPGNPYVTYTRDELFAYLATLEVDPSAPHKVDYSNLGVGLLGHVLAARAGKPWQELVRERITAPLGMDSTRVAVPDADLPRFAVGHSESGMRASYWDLPAMEAAGALRSTPDDMARLARAALNERPPFAPGFFTVQASLDGKPLDVGFNWFLRRGVAGDIWWHNGGTGGFRTLIAVMPSRGVAVVALSNSSIAVDSAGAVLLGEPARKAASANPVIDATVAALAVVLVARLGLFRFAPEATRGWRRWLRTDHDTVAGMGTMVLESLALAGAFVAFAPMPWATPSMRLAYLGLIAALLALACLRFGIAARRAPAPLWIAAPKGRNALKYGFSALVSIALLAWLAAGLA